MNNKQNIIVKALSLFALRGYDAVGVLEICTACDISKPTLYHYYGSKHGLLDAIFATYYPPFLENIGAATAYHNDIVMNLEALASVFFKFTQKEPTFSRFSMTAMFSPSESEAHVAQKRYMTVINEALEQLFSLATNDHGNMKNRKKQLSLSFTGLLRSYAGLQLTGEITLDETTTQAIVKQFMYGIFS